MVLLQVPDSLSRISEGNSNYGLFIFLGLLIIFSIIVIYLFEKQPKNSNNKRIDIRQQPNSQKSYSWKSEPSTKSVNISNTANKYETKKVAPNQKEKPEVEEAEPQITIVQERPVIGSIKETEKPEKEEYSTVKHIGYNPVNIFAQSEPLRYPYVIMPKPRSVIKFPRKGRSGRKGYKEEHFKQFIERYFKNEYQVFDDRFILVKNSKRPLEPDFTLINEKNGINIFLDVEIDEPYEGLNDISKRKPTHYQQSDLNRNNAFKNRGWIIIRFAEIQVHQQPESCCRFIADVLKSINPKYEVPKRLTNYEKVKSIRQWTKEEAIRWANEKYREKYLGITSFGLTGTGEELTGISETELGNKIEEQIEDDVFLPFVGKIAAPKTILEVINSAISSNKYLSFEVSETKTITKPLHVSNAVLTAFCYVKNRERTFPITGITNAEEKESYYTLRIAGPKIGLDQITNSVNTAIAYHKFLRMKYTRSSWTNMIVDEETGELVMDKIEAETSIRTINDVQLSINVLPEKQIEIYGLNNNYLTAYCNKREEQRTFKFNRIGEIEILNI